MKRFLVFFCFGLVLSAQDAGMVAAHLGHLQHPEGDSPTDGRPAPQGRRTVARSPASQPGRQVRRRDPVFIPGPGRDAECAVDAGLRVRLIAPGQTRPRHRRARRASRCHAHAALRHAARGGYQTERVAGSGPSQERGLQPEALGAAVAVNPGGNALHHTRRIARDAGRRLHRRGPPGRRWRSPGRERARRIREDPAAAYRHARGERSALARPPRQGSEEGWPGHRRIRHGARTNAPTRANSIRRA